MHGQDDCIGSVTIKIILQRAHIFSLNMSEKTNTQKPMQLLDLPNDMLYEIFKHIPAEESFIVRSVCKKFNENWDKKRVAPLTLKYIVERGNGRDGYLLDWLLDKSYEDGKSGGVDASGISSEYSDGARITRHRNGLLCYNHGNFCKLKDTNGMIVWLRYRYRGRKINWTLQNV